MVETVVLFVVEANECVDVPAVLPFVVFKVVEEGVAEVKTEVFVFSAENPVVVVVVADV